MDILDLIFPKECLSCGKEGNYFCRKCQGKINKVSQICPVCEKSSFNGDTHLLCKSKNSLDGLYSFFQFEDIIKEAIHKIKYEYATDLFNELFTVIFREWEESRDTLVLLNKFIAQKEPILLPVPLHWHKENIRGFNQSTVFGKALAKKLNLSLKEDILEKIKPTVSQTTLGPKERKENIRGIFKLKRQVRDLNIILIDDVWTTGATMKEAVRVLKNGGAEEIWGLTIAR